MVDFFGGGAGGAGTTSEANEEVETLRKQCEDYEQDINYLQEENENLKKQLEEKSSSPSPVKTPASQAALQDEVKRQA